MNIKWYAYYELSSDNGSCDCDWAYCDSKQEAVALADTYAGFSVAAMTGDDAEYERALVFVCQAPEQDMDDDDWMLTNHIVPGSVTTILGRIPSDWVLPA